jgi:hypothetical protein
MPFVDLVRQPRQIAGNAWFEVALISLVYSSPIPSPDFGFELIEFALCRRRAWVRGNKGFWVGWRGRFW